MTDTRQRAIEDVALPDDLSQEEQQHAWGTLYGLFDELPVPEREVWKIGAIYLRQRERVLILEAENVELKDQIAEAEDWLPGECPGYQTLGERTKLLKDQMEFASEMCAELKAKLEGR